MTTPTREQVVQWEFGEDNDGWYVSENGEQIAYGMSENVADKIVHLNNSRADLEATIAEQAAEIKRLKEVEQSALKVCNQIDEVVIALPFDYLDPPDGGDVSIGEQVRRMYEEVKTLRHAVVTDRQQLAAQQAYAEQIRDALQRLTQFNSSEEYVQVRTEHVSYGRSILSIPQDTTALQEYGAKLLEKVIRSYRESGIKGKPYAYYLGECADKIRKGGF